MSTVNLECLVDESIVNNDVVVVEKPEKSSKKQIAMQSIYGQGNAFIDIVGSRFRHL